MKSLCQTIVVGLCAAFCCAASTVYVGASFGLYRSTDSGASWAQVDIPVNNSLLGTPLAPYSIALDPHDPNKIYFVGIARASAFFSSPDGGQTWTGRPFVGIGISGSSQVDVDFGGQVIYVNALPSTGGGDLLYKSTDGGASWTQITIPLLPGTNPVPFPQRRHSELFCGGQIRRWNSLCRGWWRPIF
ncbi:MAG: hypothetical protein LAP38_06405 [Acidobacteriia bacterium]|nr:hypothetical protein [Terriglobia bacterium]